MSSRPRQRPKPTFTPEEYRYMHEHATNPDHTPIRPQPPRHLPTPWQALVAYTRILIYILLLIIVAMLALLPFAMMIGH